MWPRRGCCATGASGPRNRELAARLRQEGAGRARRQPGATAGNGTGACPAELLRPAPHVQDEMGTTPCRLAGWQRVRSRLSCRRRRGLMLPGEAKTLKGVALTHPRRSRPNIRADRMA